MPNHIKNRITLIGDLTSVATLIEKFSTIVPASINRTHDDNLIICKSKTAEFSYGRLDERTGLFERRGEGKVIGLPDDFEIEINQGFIRFPDLQKVLPMPEVLIGTTSPNRTNADECKAATGYEDWYSWSTVNWGTKWNTYSCKRITLNVFEFDTAWSGIPEMIRLISVACPAVQIQYLYSDEDTGYNCGRFEFVGGDVVNQCLPKGGSKDAYDIAFDLRPDRKENYELVGDGYAYKNND